MTTKPAFPRRISIQACSASTRHLLALDLADKAAGRRASLDDRRGEAENGRPTSHEGEHLRRSVQALAVVLVDDRERGPRSLGPLEEGGHLAHGKELVEMRLDEGIDDLRVVRARPPELVRIEDDRDAAPDQEPTARPVALADQRGGSTLSCNQGQDYSEAVGPRGRAWCC